MWIVYALFSAVFAALVAILGKSGISKIDSTLATTIRAVVMAVFLITATLSLGKFKLLHTVSANILFFIIASGIAGALSWLFYFLALKNGPASGVSAIDRLSVVFVFIFAIIFLAEKFTIKSLIGVTFITLGAVLMTLK